jgi:hypothetical protein
MQSPLAVPGPQHGITHATLATQPGLGGAPTLNPLQQNHLLTSRMYTILSKHILRKIQAKIH